MPAGTWLSPALSAVLAGLVPAIHDFAYGGSRGCPGRSPGRTAERFEAFQNGRDQPRVVVFTSTLALMAFEYGQMVCVVSTSVRASASGRPGR